MTHGFLLLLAACAPNPADVHGTGTTWRPCDGGFVCTNLAVDAAEVAVAWHPAGDPEARFAVMGQGGPGASSISLLRAVMAVYAPLDPGLWSDVNWVAMDNRGTGDSDPVSCVDPAWFDALRESEPVPRDASEEATQRGLRDAFQAGCVDWGGPVLADLGTPTAADDLDAVRQTLGVAHLDFIGYSYGTWLGAVYAAAYPEHVGRFVLDGVVAPDLTRDAFLWSQAEGFELALTRYFDRCAADPSCALGADPAATFDALLAAAAESPLPAPTDPWGRSLVRNDLRWAVSTLLYGPDDAALGDALARAVDGDAAALLAEADAGWGRDPNTGTYATPLQGYWAIGCLDAPWPSDWTDDDVWAFGESLDQAFPRLGSSLLSGELSCAGWPVAAEAPSVHAPDAPPLLLVNGAYDPATPLSGAEALEAALGNGSVLLTYEGDGHVAMFSDLSGCSYGQERAFLLSGDLPGVAGCPE